MIDRTCKYCCEVMYDYMETPKYKCGCQHPDMGLVYCDTSKSYCYKSKIHDCWDCNEMYVYHKDGEAIIGCRKEHKTSSEKECNDFH